MVDERDRSEYYRNYYLRNKDIRKFQYYEKRCREKQSKEIYEEYGGEVAYYKKKYKEFCKK